MAYDWHFAVGKVLPLSTFRRFWQASELQPMLRQGLHFVRLPRCWHDEALLTDIEQCVSLVLVLSAADAHHAATLRLAKSARLKGAKLALADFDGSEDASKLGNL